MYFTCCKLNVAARNLIEAAENAPDQASSGGRTSQVEPKRHTMHFVGQRSEEGQSVGVQRHSLDISSAERLTEGLNSSSSTGSISSPNRQVMWALLSVLLPPPPLITSPPPPGIKFSHPPPQKLLPSPCLQTSLHSAFKIFNPPCLQASHFPCF